MSPASMKSSVRQNLLKVLRGPLIISPEVRSRIRTKFGVKVVGDTVSGQKMYDFASGPIVGLLGEPLIVFNTPTSSSTVIVYEPFCRIAQSSTTFVFTSLSKTSSRPLSLHKTIPLLLKQQVSASPIISQRNPLVSCQEGRNNGPGIKGAFNEPSWALVSVVSETYVPRGMPRCPAFEYAYLRVFRVVHEADAHLQARRHELIPARQLLTVLQRTPCPSFGSIIEISEDCTVYRLLEGKSSYIDLVLKYSISIAVKRSGQMLDSEVVEQE
ncbi:hypothetical protein BDM02DRAFT_3131758 [Thelephora ganbajun]|uniref:Uncharacterized protein n=1 Tax=Thelephora ganbajun TaxID=370292 RepID=A0ACB6Z4Z7_THEGA|nr:hypothetical protein BDM02DRAFT_3131758 [Thelephora ganbajun]